MVLPKILVLAKQALRRRQRACVAPLQGALTTPGTATAYRAVVSEIELQLGARGAVQPAADSLGQY